MNNEQLDSEYPKIDLEELFRGLLRSVRHLMKQGIALVLVLTALMCVHTWSGYHPMYEATASFTVRVSNPFYATQQHYNSSAAEQMAQTFPYILSSSLLSQRVKEELNIPYMPAMNVSVLGNTNIITVSVRSDDPQMSYDVLHCVMDVYPSVAEFVVGPTSMTLISDSGVPTAPVNSRDFPRAIAKGAFLGAAVWAAAALLYWVSHRTVSSETDLGQMVNLECLGKVPTVRGYTKNKKNSYACPIITEGSDKFGFNESIRLMRVRVEREMERQHSQVIVVTSTIANEGKTTLSVNLAMSLAQKGNRVLLVDCDLRNPSVAPALGHKRGIGLSEYLQKKCELEQVLNHSDNEYLYTIGGGKPVSRPEQLLHSGRMRGLVASARKSFDYIVLDTPPCALMADTSEILSLADCSILSVRQDFACRQQILEGVQILGDSSKPILGFVMNMNAPRMGSGGYSYYSYYGHYGHYGHYGSSDHSRRTAEK